MLVITRKAGQAFLLGADTEIKILEIQGENIKLGISAPRHISILRKELKDEARKANVEAVSSITDITLKDLNDVLSRD